MVVITWIFSNRAFYFRTNFLFLRLNFTPIGSIPNFGSCASMMFSNLGKYRLVGVSAVLNPYKLRLDSLFLTDYGVHDRGLEIISD